MDMLVLSDANGIVDMTHEAIARRTNRPLELIRRTILELESPDLRSRTPDADGRRLKRLDEHRDWGWVIVNYDTFRKIASEEQRREKTAARVSKYRDKVRGVTHRNAPVTQGNDSLRVKRHAEATTEATTVCENKTITHTPADANLPTWDEVKQFAERSGIKPESAKTFYDHHEGNQLWINQHGRLINWHHKIVTWATNDRAKPPKAEAKDPSKMTKHEILMAAIQ